MKKIRIVADDRIPFLRESPLSAFCDMTFLPGAGISKQELLTADAVITRTRTRCNAETLDGTNVKLIATATIGYDHIDTVYCARRGIVWRNAPGCNAPSVAQYLTSLLVSFSLKYNMPLKGRVLGVIGAGNVGRRVIETASALGMTVLVNDPPREENEGHSGFTALDEICREADFITFHVPLERSGKYPTFHLADQRFLGSLKPGAVVINTSRGEVVDNPELKRALTGGRAPHAENLGGPAIVGAINASQILSDLPVTFKFYGATGNDGTADFLRSIIAKTPLDASNYVTLPGASPSTDVLSDPRAHDGKGERTFINTIGACYAYTPEQLPAAFYEADIIWFGATALVPSFHEKLSVLLKRSHEAGKINVV